MSRYRPNSAQIAFAIVSIALTTGCSSAGGSRWFAKTEPEVPPTIASIEGNSRRLSDNETVQATRLTDVTKNQIAVISDSAPSEAQPPQAQPSQAQPSQIQLASSRTTDSMVPPPVQSQPTQSQKGQPPGTAPSDIAQPANVAGEQGGNSIATAARGALDALKSTIPGLSKPAEPDLAEEIAKFEKFPFAFELPTVAGETNGSQHFKGQLMVVDIWATWCAHVARRFQISLQSRTNLAPAVFR